MGMAPFFPFRLVLIVYDKLQVHNAARAHSKAAIALIHITSDAELFAMFTTDG
jgi:hypothetical protein